MNNLRMPEKDSAAWRGIITAFQVLVTFTISLWMVIWHTPGVPQNVEQFIITQGPPTLLSVGIPMIVGTGIISFVMNWLFRSNIKTY